MPIAQPWEIPSTTRAKQTCSASDRACVSTRDPRARVERSLVKAEGTSRHNSQPVIVQSQPHVPCGHAATPPRPFLAADPVGRGNFTLSVFWSSSLLAPTHRGATGGVRLRSGGRGRALEGASGIRSAIWLTRWEEEMLRPMLQRPWGDHFGGDHLSSASQPAPSPWDRVGVYLANISLAPSLLAPAHYDRLSPGPIRRAPPCKCSAHKLEVKPPGPRPSRWP